jgi:hypothetical protein
LLFAPHDSVAYRFQQLFRAVTGFCGMSPQIEATGYSMPLLDLDTEEEDV